MNVIGRNNATRVPIANLPTQAPRNGHENDAATSFTRETLSAGLVPNQSPRVRFRARNALVRWANRAPSQARPPGTRPLRSETASRVFDAGAPPEFQTGKDGGFLI